MTGAFLPAAVMSGREAAADSPVPGPPLIGDVATGSAAPSALDSGSAAPAIPLALGPAPFALALHETGSAGGTLESTADPIAQGEPIALGLDEGTLLAACGGVAAAGGSAFLLGSATGSGLLGSLLLVPGSAGLGLGSAVPALLGSAAPAATGSAAALSGSAAVGMTGSAAAALLGSAGAVMTGSAVPALLGSAMAAAAGSAAVTNSAAAGSALTGSGLGSAAAGSALSGSALLLCLLAVPVTPPTPGIPLIIPSPSAAVPGAPAAVAAAVPTAAIEPESGPTAIAPVLDEAETTPPVGWDTLELVTVLLLTVIVGAKTSSADKFPRA